MNERKLRQLTELSKEARQLLTKMIGQIGVGHVGGSLSLIEALVYLYYEEMRVRPEEPGWPDRAACLSPSLRPSGTGLELTVPVELTVERSRRCTWDAITAAELTEPEPGRRPSLVLCRPKKGESLWELAKRYRTDEQAICAANGLEQETPLPSGLLLIPRVR